MWILLQNLNFSMWFNFWIIPSILDFEWFRFSLIQQKQKHIICGICVKICIVWKYMIYWRAYVPRPRKIYMIYSVIPFQIPPCVCMWFFGDDGDGGVSGVCVFLFLFSHLTLSFCKCSLWFVFSFMSMLIPVWFSCSYPLLVR